MTDQPPGFRVRAARDKRGQIIGFQDPDKGNRFITREAAIPRLRYSSADRSIVDSFGTKVGVGALRLPGRGRMVTYAVKSAEYRSLDQDARRFRPAGNQEVIERTVLVGKDGQLISDETSSGLGKRYDQAKRGGHWRKTISDALGLKDSERLPTRDLERAVVYREFIVKTIKG